MFDVMHYAIPVRYLARVFVDAQNLVATLEDGIKLAQQIGSPSLIPQFAFERALDGTTRQRLVLLNLQGWQVALLSDTFDLTCLPTDLTGSNVGDFRAFASTAQRVLAACSSYFGRIPHRAALIQEGMLGEMPHEEMDAVARRLLRLPPSFESTFPFEWDWRCARHGQMRIGDINEQTNVLATVKRLSGVLQSPKGERLNFDRLRVDLDVNTVVSDSRGRFTEPTIRQFYEQAVDEHARLDDELTSYLFGTCP